MTRDFEAHASRASLVVSIVVTTAVAASTWLDASWPLALVGPCALLWLMHTLRAFASTRSSLPNVITLVRVLATAWLGLVGPTASGLYLGACIFLVFVLDGLDGLTARRLGAVSPQGAHLDMESDAFLVMTTCVLLVQRGVPAWALVGGLLRYAYVIALATFDARGEVPRSRFGRYVFALSLHGYVFACLTDGAIAEGLAASSSALLLWSFGRSFYWSFRDTSAQAIETTS